MFFRSCGISVSGANTGSIKVALLELVAYCAENYRIEYIGGPKDAN